METKHEEIVEILKIGMMMEKERFKEVELLICKGRQLQMKDFVNHLKVCVDSIDYDLKRKVPPKDVLETTKNAMQNMIKAFTEELDRTPQLISKKIAEKDEVECDCSGKERGGNAKASGTPKAGSGPKKKAAKRSTAAVG
jgi:hypothetical protein